MNNRNKKISEKWEVRSEKWEVNFVGVGTSVPCSMEDYNA